MSKKNIVVIDDNQNDLLMAKFVIMRMGFNPVLVERPKKIIEILQTQSVSLIVLDYEMPEMSGIEVLKRIRKIDSLRHIPIVMLTGNSSADHVKKSVAMGAVDYIVKPIDPSVFESKINKILALNGPANPDTWIEYQVQKNQQTEVKMLNYSQVVSIGELSLTLKTSQPFPVGFTFFSDAPFFTDLEIKNPALKVELSIKQGSDYLIQCSMIGLSESELKKIRLYHKLLVRNLAA